VIGCWVLLMAFSVCRLFKWRQFEPEVILLAAIVLVIFRSLVFAPMCCEC
jgi:hypothetical protein